MTRRAVGRSTPWSRDWTRPAARPPSASPTPAGPPTAGPTENNANPHLSRDGRIALVHNGIIENYRTLRTFLEQQGTCCVTETDTEVLAQLIGHFYNGNLEQAVRDALHEVQGTYGIAVVSADEPDRIVAARKGSPLIIGIGDGEYIVASDAAAIIAHTHQVIYLSDGEMATVSRDGFRTMTLEAVPVTKEVTEVEFSLDQIELGGHEHFMAKEIFEQPISLANTLRGRLDARQGIVTLGASPICLATWPGPPFHLHRPGHGLARRLAGRVPLRGRRQDPGRNRVRQRVSLPNPR